MNIARMFLLAFNLLLVCARNLATEKNISRRGGSTEIIGIFTLARNPLGAAEADILTLLHNFCNNSQTAKGTSTRKVLWEKIFHRAYFEALEIALRCHWRTQTGEKLKKQSSQNKGSGYVQKPVAKSTNTLEKCIRHRKCQPGPKACKTFIQELCKFFGK